MHAGSPWGRRWRVTNATAKRSQILSGAISANARGTAGTLSAEAHRGVLREATAWAAVEVPLFECSDVDITTGQLVQIPDLVLVAAQSWL